MEICLDCKEKLIFFYHFKRKVKEAHKITTNINGRKNVQPRNKQSKIVQNILKIVENYAEKCSISTIQVDESNRKLIIEPSDDEPGKDVSSASTTAQLNWSLQDLVSTVKEEPVEENYDQMWEDVETSPETSLNFSDIVVKEEPQEQPIIFSKDLSSSEQHTNHAGNPPTQRRRYNERQVVRVGNESIMNISKAALKMRAYRERLRKPENKLRYLLHLEQQREWNRKHYIKKQVTTGKPRISRRRTTATSLDLE